VAARCFFITLTLVALRRPTVCCEERPWSAFCLWAWLWARGSFYLSGSTFFYNAHACCVAQTHRLLRGKALECISLVGMAVGKGFILFKWQHVFFFLTLTLVALRRPTVCCEERPWSASRLWAWLWARTASGKMLREFLCVGVGLGVGVGKDRFREDAA